jgi:hypothetical protein
MAKTEKKYGVLRWDMGRCYTQVPHETAKAMVAEGVATWTDRQAVRLIRPSHPPRGLSAKASEKLSQRFVDAQFSDDDDLAVAAVNGWAPAEANP